jgi:hypothetical protein
MKFVQQITYDLGSLEYYRDELGWNVETIEDVVEIIEDWNDEELRTLLGYATDYKCWTEE